jgi:dolichol-phosphate mannosyltransferase
LKNQEVGVSNKISPTDQSCDISVVVPVYGCKDCLNRLVERASTTLSHMRLSFEIILVDDCSPDGSWSEILRLIETTSGIRGIRLSRNFGQHAAITAGIASSRGDWIAVMDCDLQDPPELLAELYARAQLGAEVVVARRRTRMEAWHRRLVSRVYFAILRRLGNVIDGTDGALSLMSRNVANAYLTIRDHDRHHAMLLRWLGFRQETIVYDQAPRFDGSSSYSFGALIESAIQGILFHSTKLLRLLIYGGLAMAFTGLMMVPALIALHFMVEQPTGWTSLAVLLLVIGGGIIISVGTVGLYVGRIFDQIRGRPMYIIAESRELLSEVPVIAVSTTDSTRQAG